MSDHPGLSSIRLRSDDSNANRRNIRIKAPDRLGFGTATLLAAACCIPAILSLASMWNMILKINWKRRFGDDEENKDQHIPIPGTNAATPAKMGKVNDRIRFYLSMVEIPVFGAAILAILVYGELNFFSYRLAYMTEPIASVGKLTLVIMCSISDFNTFHLGHRTVGSYSWYWTRSSRLIIRSLRYGRRNSGYLFFGDRQSSLQLLASPPKY